jgi:RNA polymerase sigma factor (sigma-70 family)
MVLASHVVPEVVARLLNASEPRTRDAAWAEFVRSHSKLLLHVARSLGGDHDAAMDRYAYVLERLREDQSRRLYTFVADGRCEFSTWLVVVVQRLCLDHRRQRYGRSRRPANDRAEQDLDQIARRRLIDFIAADVDLSAVCDVADGAEDCMRLAQIHRVLETALETLPARDRLMVKLRYEDGIPMPEIARHLGFADRFHAYRHLDGVLLVLRSLLERSGVSDTVP